MPANIVDEMHIQNNIAAGYQLLAFQNYDSVAEPSQLAASISINITTEPTQNEAATIIAKISTNTHIDHNMVYGYQFFNFSES